MRPFRGGVWGHALPLCPADGDSPAAEEAPGRTLFRYGRVDGGGPAGGAGLGLSQRHPDRYRGTTMDPEGGVTRAEAAAMLARYDRTSSGDGTGGGEGARRAGGGAAGACGPDQWAPPGPARPHWRRTETLMAAAQIRAEERGHGRSGQLQPCAPRRKTVLTVLGDRLTGYASENLAMVRLSAREAVTVWENSSGHYQNMVNPEITRIGVGLARPDSGLYLLLPDLYGRLMQTGERAGVCRPFSKQALRG